MVSSEFWNLALAECQARGVKELPLVKVPHPVGTIGLDALRAVAESAVDAISAKLVRGGGAGSASDFASPEVGEGSTAATLAVPSDPAEMFGYFFARGWTDGLPVLPPTLAAVAKMLAAGAQRADSILGVIPPLNGVATAEKVAANAVLAGCLPEYFPLVLAAVRG